IVGNLISNTIIVFVALTVSLKLAIGALVFLVAIHKLEYLLNSKIIGDRIRNPVWLTLIALIIGERLMGIPGLILAPVVLNYLRVEMLTVEVRPAQEKIELVKSPVHESFRSSNRRRAFRCLGLTFLITRHCDVRYEGRFP